MKKKSIISIIVLCIFVFTLALFSACNSAPTVKEIKFKDGTVKSVYTLNEQIDYSSIKLIVEYSDQTTKELALTESDDITYSPIDTSTVGQKVLSATYKDKVAEMNVEVVKTLSNIDFVQDSIAYSFGDAVDYSAINVKFTYDDGSEEVKNLTTQGFVFDEIDTNKLGEQTFIVTFGEFSATINVSIVEAEVNSIEFQESMLTYDFKDDFVLQDIKLKVTYDNQTLNKVISLSDPNVSITQPISLKDKALVGETQTLKVEYKGKTAQIYVVVNKVLVGIEFKGDVQTEYFINDVIDYSKIYIIVSYNDDSTIELPLTDNAVDFDEIDTSVEGSVNFQAVYMDKSTEEITIEVKPLIAPEQFTMPKAYQQYLTKSQDNTYKVKSDVENNPYIVGSINKFNFVPVTTYFDFSIGDYGDIVTIENPLTVFKLYEIVEGQYVLVDSPNTYVTVENNMYKFNSTANDKFFKMEVTLDENRYDLSYWTEDNFDVPVISIEFKVVDAYNAYDTFGLSVVDNLNVKNWAEIKNRTLKYDDKKLSEYTDVKLVVLHNDIVINADELPENYFWSEDMYGYDTAIQNCQKADELTNGKSDFAGRLKGSLRDGIGGHTYNHCDANELTIKLNSLDKNGNLRKDYVETWACQNVQKGIFNTNQTSINGNYMTISTKDGQTRHLTSILSQDYNENDVNSMINQISHWSLFKFYKDDNQVANQATVNLSFENITLKGNMPKINEDGQEAGLMAMNTFIDKMTINNSITTQFYTHIVCDGGTRGTCILEFNDSIMTDAYSNMFYLWRSNVTVNNSTLKNAGGPLFILCDADRTTETSDGPVLNIDSESELESYAAGTEAWYQMYDAQPLVNMLKGTVNAPLKNGLGKTFVHNVNTVDQINIIAVMIPNPESIFTSPSDPINIKGKVIRDGEEEFDMESPYVTNVVKPNNTIGFLSGNQFAFMGGDLANPSLLGLDSGTPGQPVGFATKSSDMLTLVLSAKLAESTLTNAPYFGVVLGDYLPVQG